MKPSKRGRGESGRREERELELREWMRQRWTSSIRELSGTKLTKFEPVAKRNQRKRFPKAKNAKNVQLGLRDSVVLVHGSSKLAILPLLLCSQTRFLLLRPSRRAVNRPRR